MKQCSGPNSFTCADFYTRHQEKDKVSLSRIRRCETILQPGIPRDWKATRISHGDGKQALRLHRWPDLDFSLDFIPRYLSWLRRRSLNRPPEPADEEQWGTTEAALLTTSVSVTQKLTIRWRSYEMINVNLDKYLEFHTSESAFRRETIRRSGT